jgi:hypothetical protein
MPEFDDLSDQLQGVTPDSPSGDEDHETEDQLDTQSEQETLDDSQAEEGIEEKKQERDLNNIYREFARKQQDHEERMTKRFESVIDRLNESLRAIPQTASEPVEQDGNQLDKTPLDQLRQMRGQVPEEQKVAFEDYLIERTIKEETNKFKSEFTRAHEVGLARRESNQMAMNRYPELQDKASDFYKFVAREIGLRGGKKYISTNPTAVLDVANEVAQSQGLQPQAARRLSRLTPHQPAANKGNKPVQSSDTETISDEKANAIKQRLERDIPGISIDIKKIKERHKLYHDNKDLFVR